MKTTGTVFEWKQSSIEKLYLTTQYSYPQQTTLAVHSTSGLCPGTKASQVGCVVLHNELGPMRRALIRKVNKDIISDLRQMENLV